MWIVLLFGLSLRNIERTTLSNRPLTFNAENAHKWMTKLAKDFPYRFTWSDSRKSAAKWLKSEFIKLGYTPKGMQFSEVIAGKRYTDLENIYAEKKGAKFPDQIIVFSAHYDVAETTKEGAMDDAAGIGIVLEMARLFTKIESERSLIFLLTDSEEFGAFWGAHNFVNQFDRVNQIIANINFDFVSPDKQVSIFTLCDGSKEGYTPLWLREMAMDSVRSLKTVAALDFINIMEHIERALLIPPADHGEFLASGIPAFNWFGQTDNLPYVMAHYHHTTNDIAEIIRVESIADFGKATERLTYSLNELPNVRSDFRNSSYWKVTADRYIDGPVVTIIHILFFIPFLMLTLLKISKARNLYTKVQRINVFWNEAKKMGILSASLISGYVIMRILPFLNIITRYENFPATQKSPVLYAPKFIAIVLVFVAIGVIYYILRKSFYEKSDELDLPEVRQAFHGILLSILIALAMLKNTYLATIMLLPTAYFWVGIKRRKKIDGRIINFLLILGGSLSMIALLLILTNIFHIGIVYWYLFLATTYGLFSAYAVVISLFVFALLIRQFSRFVLK